MPQIRRGDDFGSSLAGPIRTRRPFGIPGTAGRDATGSNRSFPNDRQYEDYAAYSAIRTCPEFYEDFIKQGLGASGYTLAANAANPGPFVAQTTTTAGAPAVALQALANGVVEAVLAANNEVEFAGITFGDTYAPIPMNKAFYWQTILNVNPLPVAGAFFIAGLSSAYANPITGISRYVWFRLSGNGLLLAESKDGVTTNLAQPLAPNAQVTLVAGTNYLFTIVGKGQLGRNSGFAEFWLDDNFLGKLNIAGADTTLLQPIIGVGKTTGTGVPAIFVDMCRAFWDRF